MIDLVALTVLPAATGLAMAVGVRPVLARLPEPVDGESEGKTRYRDLPSAAFVTGCVLMAVAAQLVAVVVLPGWILPMWSVLATVGVLLVAVDGCTTWLPSPLMRAGWVLMAIALAVSVLAGGTLADAGRSAIGAVVAGALYLLIWFVTRGGFGFGDVRFAPLLGAASAGQSWTLLIWGLTLGTVVGAVHGAVRLAARRMGSFPYAPAMLTGCYLAAIALWLLPDAAGGR